VNQVKEAFGQLASSGDLNGNGGFIVLRSALPPHQMDNALRATVRLIAASGLLCSLLFGVSPWLAAVGLLLLAGAESASPALNAASIDPMQALHGK
jgi:hypothetical protein